jgi:transposase-like protein
LRWSNLTGHDPLARISECEKYDEVFKREAVRKIHDGQSVASVARELGCAESLLYRWKRDALETGSDSEKELIALRKRLRDQDHVQLCLNNGGQTLAKDRPVAAPPASGPLVR